MGLSLKCNYYVNQFKPSYHHQISVHSSVVAMLDHILITKKEMNWGKEGKLYYRANHSKSFTGLCIFDNVATVLQTSHPNDLLMHTETIFFP